MTPPAPDPAAAAPIPVPVRHSILDATALAPVLQRLWDLPGPVRCHLFHRGMNDVYRVQSGGRLYAARVWRANWRTLDNVRYETAFLPFLDQAGLPVAPPVFRPDGSAWALLSSEEGLRPVALFPWAPGRAFGDAPSASLAHDLGVLFGRMHRAGRDFVPPVDRQTNPISNLEDHLPDLLDLLGDDPVQHRLFADAVAQVTAAVRAIDRTRVPRGPTHGDFHFNNCVIDDGHITLLDFDNAGEDYLVQDLMCYAWANGYGGLDPVYVTAFLEGYETIRPLESAEREVMPLLILAKELRLITGFAHHVNATGFFALRFRSLDWFAGSVRQHMRDAGLTPAA